MSLLQQINTAAKSYVPPEEPIIEMHPMTKMMLKAMGDEDPEKKYENPKKKKKKKSLKDYLKIKSTAPA